MQLENAQRTPHYGREGEVHGMAVPGSDDRNPAGEIGVAAENGTRESLD